MPKAVKILVPDMVLQKQVLDAVPVSGEIIIDDLIKALSGGKNEAVAQLPLLFGGGNPVLKRRCVSGDNGLEQYISRTGNPIPSSGGK